MKALPDALEFYNEEHHHRELGGLPPDYVFRYPESVADIVRGKVATNKAIAPNF